MRVSGLGNEWIQLQAVHLVSLLRFPTLQPLTQGSGSLSKPINSYMLVERVHITTICK